MNKNTVKLTKQNMRNPMPLKIYRKEIASVQITHPKNQRIGVSIDEYNRPNGHTSTTITPPINTEFVSPLMRKTQMMLITELIILEVVNGFLRRLTMQCALLLTKTQKIV